MKILLSLLGFLTLGGLATGQAQTIIGNAADLEINAAGNTEDAISTTLVIGRNGGANLGNTVAVLVFDLDSVDTSFDFQTASLSIYLNSVTGTPAWNVDLYGVGFSDSNSASTITSLTSYTVAANDTSETKIAENLFTPLSPTSVYYNVTNTALQDYLNTRPGTDSRYVFFRLNSDNGSQVGLNGNFYTITSGDASSNQPLLVVPEPTTFAMLLGGAGLLMLRRRRR